mmetsp:Transcript_11211/g.20452  ORF Transcript_11211/g.20452 Transcript_11211/m.20452 type:complete len:133 (+) Transcript_11211:41-439(+)
MGASQSTTPPVLSRDAAKAACMADRAGTAAKGCVRVGPPVALTLSGHAVGGAVGVLLSAASESRQMPDAAESQIKVWAKDVQGLSWQTCCRCTRAFETTQPPELPSHTCAECRNKPGCCAVLPMLRGSQRSC